MTSEKQPVLISMTDSKRYQAKSSFFAHIPPVCWLFLVVIVLSWIPYLRVVSTVVSIGDEGLVAQSALRISQGQIPYRDFFSTIAPGAYYFYAALFCIFEPSFLVLRLGVMLVALLLLLSVWLVLVRLKIRSPLPYLVTASFLAYFGGPVWFIASHHWLAAACCIAACAFLIPADESDSPAIMDVALSGFLSALAAFFLQHRGGIWIIAACPVFLLLPRGRRLPSFAAFWCGIAALAVPAALYLLSTAGWETLFYDLITFPLTQYNKLAGHQGTLFSHLTQLWQKYLATWKIIRQPLGILKVVTWSFSFIALLIIYLLPLIGSIMLFRMRRFTTCRKYQWGCLTACFVASYLAMLHRPSSSTIAFAASAAVIVFALYLNTSADTGASRSRRLVAIAWIMLFSITATGYSLLKLLPIKATLVTPAGAVQLLYQEEGATFSGITTFVTKTLQPSETVFCYPYNPLYYFLFKLTNPTPFDTLTWPMHTEKQLEQALTLLKASKCRWIILSLTDRQLQRELPLEKYIGEHYAMRRSFQQAMILERLQ